MSNKTIILDIDGAIERMGDAEIYREIAHVFAERLEATLAEIQGSIDAEDAPASTRFAHSLKGNCATLGAEVLREKSLELELLCKAGEFAKANAFFQALRPELLRLKMALLDI